MINDTRQASNNAQAHITLGADKGYDAKEFIDALQKMNVIPHVAQNTSGRRSAVPKAIAASAGYAISAQKRKLIEQGFGWAKTVGRMRQVMVRAGQLHLKFSPLSSAFRLLASRQIQTFFRLKVVLYARKTKILRNFQSLNDYDGDKPSSMLSVNHMDESGCRCIFLNAIALMVRGLKKVDQMFVLTMAAYNLTRMRSLGQVRLQTP